MIVSVAHAAEAVHAAHGSVFQDPTFWVGVSFCLVAVLLAKPVGNAILGLLNKRADDIRTQIADGEELKKQAEELLARYKKKQAGLQNEIDGMMKKTQADIEKLKAAAQADFDKSLKKREEQSFKRLKSAKDEVVFEIRNTAADISVKAAEQILKESLLPEKREQIVLQTIDELPDLLKARPSL